MITYQEYILKDKWKQTRLLEGLTDDCKCYLTLEAQVSLNEKMPDNFKRISLPILRRMFGQLPETFVGSNSVLKEWKKVKLNDLLKELDRDDRVFSLDNEAKIVGQISECIANSFEKMIKEDQKVLIGGIIRDGGAISVNYDIV